jgi:hypothetical protein
MQTICELNKKNFDIKAPLLIMHGLRSLNDMAKLALRIAKLPY